jgi:alanine dehydrogenase
MSTLFLSRKDVRSLLNMAEIIEAVEQALKDFAVGRAWMPVKAYLIVDKGDFRAMPAALPGAAGMKWVCAHPENPSKGLPAVIAVIIYSDPATGYPLAIMDATDMTAYRTGATAAIASRYLARENSQILGLVGAGRQAYAQLAAHAELFNLKQIKVYDRLCAATERFIKSFPQYKIRACFLEETADSDILCTLTPSRKPFLRKVWVKPGTHINAVGADAPGKEELSSSILKEAIVVVDDMEQASVAGEINVPLKKGLFKVENIYATLGEIVAGRKGGRNDEKSITVFDSTGLAIEDIAVARLIYEKAKRKGSYLSLDFVEG